MSYQGLRYVLPSTHTYIPVAESCLLSGFIDLDNQVLLDARIYASHMQHLYMYIQ